jgi:hypothetical protein
VTRLTAALSVAICLSAAARAQECPQHRDATQQVLRELVDEANRSDGLLLVRLQPHPDTSPANATAPGTMAIPEEDQTPVEEEDPGSAVPS